MLDNEVEALILTWRSLAAEAISREEAARLTRLADQLAALRADAHCTLTGASVVSAAGREPVSIKRLRANGFPVA